MRIILIILFLFSCNTKRSVIVKYPNKVKQDSKSKQIDKPIKIVPGELELRWGNSKWDKFLISEIKSTKLHQLEIKDSKEFNFTSDKIKSWAKLFVEMAYYESKFNPNESYKESFGLYSRGLFQLSKVDSGRYRCNFTTELSVNSPEANIRCAVRVMYKLVKKNKRIAGKIKRKWQGGARYWAVLRGTRKYTLKALKAIKSANRSLK